MQKELINGEDPMGTYTWAYIEQWADPYIEIGVDSIKVERMDEFEDRFHEIIDKVLDEGIDLERLRTKRRFIVLKSMYIMYE